MKNIIMKIMWACSIRKCVRGANLSNKIDKTNSSANQGAVGACVEKVVVHDVQIWSNIVYDVQLSKIAVAFSTFRLRNARNLQKTDLVNLTFYIKKLENRWHWEPFPLLWYLWKIGVL